MDVEAAAFRAICSYEAVALNADLRWLPPVTRFVRPLPWPARIVVTAALAVWLATHFELQRLPWPAGRVLP